MTETTPSTASWITAPGTDPQHPILRTRFTPRDRVTSARLLVSGLGAFHAHLNGSRVSADELAPGQTHFGTTVLLNAYDVTDLMNQGANALAVEVGRGFYAMNTPNVWGWHAPSWKGSCRALAELHLEYADGSTEAIITGPHWKASTGPITADSMYGGEDYDCRLDLGDWTSADFDDSPGRCRDRRLSRRRADDHPGGARPGAGGRDLRRLAGCSSVHGAGSPTSAV